ncbi:putative phenazine antibiotic biosynthesis domain protein [Mycobacterium xenopi 4042]|uniref:Putative phenazine antibiotic biosynthesis domain protein n=1 Tax=Mycobacterium xenopi 4042 TaxID=1299334 RepID=X7ZB63_MYCXE|nr:putative phenazine antibiotic biosynthesis domain protein [Mycobacterium xenopi 4042]
MARIDVSLLEVPRSEPVEDPEAYLRAAVAWHFSEDTGSPFWLRIAATLNFDPLTDINTFADLRLFPDLVNELRTAPVEDLIPRGYGSPPPLPQIFESGGTTGAPKRTVQMPDWIEQVVRWQTEDFTAGGFLPGRGFLCLMPSGPHGWATSPAWSRRDSARSSTRSIWIRAGSKSSLPATPPPTCWPTSNT